MKIKHKTIGLNNYNWVEDWKRLNPSWTEVQISFIGSLLQDCEELVRKQSYEMGYKEGVEFCKEEVSRQFTNAGYKLKTTQK